MTVPMSPYFQAIPNYPLPTSIPFTRQTALTFIERMEDIYTWIKSIGGIVEARDEAYSKLIDDANTAISTALDTIKQAESDVLGTALLIKEALGKVDAATAALVAANEDLDAAREAMADPYALVPPAFIRGRRGT